MANEVEKKTTEDVEEPISQPELVETTFNNQTVKVPKETADVLSKMEHDYKSGQDKILHTERETMQTEQKAHNEKFTQDLKNVNELIYKGATDLTKYGALVDGGDGKYFGEFAEEREAVHNTVENPTIQPNQFSEINKRMAELEKGIEDNKQQAAYDAIATAKSVAKDFSGSDAYADAVVAVDMRIFDDTYKRAPNEKEIRGMFAKRQTKVGITTQKPVGSEVNIPNTQGGGTPSVPTEPIPKHALDDHEWMVKRVLANIPASE